MFDVVFGFANWYNGINEELFGGRYVLSKVRKKKIALRKITFHKSRVTLLLKSTCCEFLFFFLHFLFFSKNLIWEKKSITKNLLKYEINIIEIKVYNIKNQHSFTNTLIIKYLSHLHKLNKN